MSANPFTQAACSVADLHCDLRNMTPDPADIPALKEAIATELSGKPRVSVINLFKMHMNRCAKAKEVPND